MKEHYAVTIGIPVFRSVDYICDTMNSVLNQIFPDIEFLIIDDRGDDGTMDVVKYIKNNHPRGNDIRILENNKNYGVSYSRNRIIDEAKGDFLYFMDSDDIIESKTIKLLYDAVNDNFAQIAYGSYEIIDRIGDSANQVYNKNALVLLGENELAMYAFKNNHVFHVSACNNLISLPFLRQTGVKFLDIPYWEDMVYTTELVIKVNKSVLLPDVTYHYIRHKGSLSHYQNHDVITKRDILRNVFALNYLKEKCRNLIEKPYLSYLCYNLERDSFYAVCHIIKNSYRITPAMSSEELRNILYCPLSIIDIMKFKHKRASNCLFWLMSNIPIKIFLPSIWLLGKIKRAI